MKLYINKWMNIVGVVVVAVNMLSACNKDLPLAQPIVQPQPSGITILEKLNDPNYSFLKAAVTRASTVPSPTGTLSTLLSDKRGVYTFFAADDNAFKASLTVLGLPADISSINFFRPGQLDTIIKYHLIGGQKYTSAIISPVSPSFNLYLQSSFLLAAPSATLPPGLRMPIFIGKQASVLFANNIPVIQPDIEVANGVMHSVAFLVTPPSQVLKLRIAADPNLTYFNAAIARADSGQAGLNKFDSLLNYAITNMTVLAPNDAAFQTLIYGLVFGKVFAATGDAAIANALANGAVAAGPAFLSTNNVTTADIRGIVAYHFLASNPKGAYEPNYRAFSVNFSSIPAFVKTLVNSSVAVHPGILAQASFTGPIVSSLNFSSYGSFPPGGAPFSYTANTVVMDRHAVNGVYHIIDKVLLPQ